MRVNLYELYEFRKMSHYDTLGVPKDADGSAIKKAYRKLCMTFHPDKCGGDGEEFKKISEAYEVLSDPEKKAKYDNPLRNPAFTSSFYSPTSSQVNLFPSMDTNFFASLFGGIPGQPQHTPQHTTSQNINHRVLLTLEDFYAGKACKFAISRKVQCADCNGEGGWGKKHTNCIGCNGQGFRVSQRGNGGGGLLSRSACIQCRGHKMKTVFDKICKSCKTLGVVPQRVVAEAKFEAGSRPGDTIVLKGMSDCVRGKQPGDVVVTASEKSHRIFKRLGKKNDLKCSIDISLRQSLCGFTAEITHLDGRIIEVKSDKHEGLAKITPHGHKIVVQGEGIPKGQGRLEILVNVVFPEFVPESVAPKLAECLDVLENQ